MIELVRLLRCVGRAAVKHGLRVLTGVVPLGPELGEMARDVLADYRKENRETALAGDLQAAAQASASETREAAEQVAAEVAAEQPLEVRQGLASYLAQVPGSVRRSLRRPDDPTGTTIPFGLKLHSPEDLAAFLPNRLPRFTAGEYPLPGVDRSTSSQGTASGLPWVAAALRSAHPVPWFVGVVGAFLTWGLCAAALAIFGEASSPEDSWWGDPLGELARLGQTVFGEGVGSAVFRGLLLGLPLYVLWTILGVGLARWEGLAQLRDLRPDQAERVEVNRARVLAFAARRSGSALMSVLLVAVFVGFVSLPGFLAGLLNHIPGFGPLLVALLLPVFLLCNLVLVVVVLGSVGHWLAPPTLALEGTDVWEAISRSYSYFYQATGAFLWREALALAVSSLPVAVCAALLRGEFVPGDAIAPLLLASSGLSFACFWGLQVRVYLALRHIIDDTDEDEMFLEDKEESSTPAASLPPAPGQTTGPSTAAAAPAPDATSAPTVSARPFRLGFTLWAMLLACMAWIVTCEFITTWGGPQGRWVRWGLDGRFRPEAEGIESVASFIAFFWGFCFFAVLLLRPLWRAAFPRQKP
jgi:hypothetical protein